MKTSFGKLSALALILALAWILLGSMRSGMEDQLIANVDSLTLNPGSTATVLYELRSESIQTVEYRSENPGVASVDQKGQVTALSPGKTMVRIQASGGAETSVDVEVQGVPVTSIALNTDTLKMNKGEVSGLSCRFNWGASSANVQWTSSNPDVVQVDGAGRVTAVSGGQARVTATVGGLSASALVSVHVSATSALVTPGDLKVGVGTEFQMKVRFLPEDATDEPERWTSSDPKVLSVDENGMMRAVAVGTATIAMKTRQGLTGSAQVIVEPASQDFQISPTQVTIERGASHALDASFIGKDGQPDGTVDHHVEWISSDPDVVRVEDGVVTGVKTGTATVTASADGFHSSCSVRVETPVREVALNMTEMYLLKEQTNQTFQLQADIQPQDADSLTLTYATDNPLVARVSEDGLVTLTGGYGTAVITATAQSGASATFTVHVVVKLPEVAQSELEE